MFGVQLFLLFSAQVINLSELGFVYLVVSGVCPRAECMPPGALLQSCTLISAPQGSSLVTRSSGWPRVRLAHLETSMGWPV